MSDRSSAAASNASAPAGAVFRKHRVQEAFAHLYYSIRNILAKQNFSALRIDDLTLLI